MRMVLFGLLASVAALPASNYSLARHTVQNAERRNAVCNDGSPAVYHIRKGAPTSKRWLIFFPGGFWCWDEYSCTRRAQKRPWRTSSTRAYAEMKPPNFLLDGSNSVANPDFHDANLASIFYCSSDAYSGDRGKLPAAAGKNYSEKDSATWHFRGKSIVAAVLQDLVDRHGLGTAEQVMLMGTSAGGLGVMNNADESRALLKKRAPRAAVLGLMDSGWFMDMRP
jgi:hypothetical protein